MGKCTDNLTLGEIKELLALFGGGNKPMIVSNHPMLGRHCVVRTYSAGVFIGTVKAVDGMEMLLTSARRLWKWEGAFTLSEVATAGVLKASRIAEEVDEVYLTQVVEVIPTTETARGTFEKCHEK